MSRAWTIPWWDNYLAGDSDKVDVIDLDRVLDWEGSGKYERPSELDPSCYKDSGCAEDKFEETMKPRRKNQRGVSHDAAIWRVLKKDCFFHKFGVPAPSQ